MEWSLHVLRWVIDDGEPERQVNDVFYWFAVSFWSEAMLARATENYKYTIPLADNYYRANAEVLYISQDPEQAGCILDFGIRAISEMGGLLGVPLPPGCREGDYVNGVIRLALPLCTVVHPYDLCHKWRINRISADLTDFSDHPGDLGSANYQDIPGTDAVKAGSYILHCSYLAALAANPGGGGLGR